MLLLLLLYRATAPAAGLARTIISILIKSWKNDAQRFFNTNDNTNREILIIIIIIIKSSLIIIQIMPTAIYL